jgi:hypothetical protein
MECHKEGGGSASIAAGEEGQRLDDKPHREVREIQTAH